MRPHALLSLLAAALICLSPYSVPPARAQTAATIASAPEGALAFSETGQWLAGAFRSYWERNGGLKQFGYPISPPLRGQDGMTIQWLERARFELHDDRPPGQRVLLGLLGREVTAQRAAAPPFQPVADPGNESWFRETGHTLRGGFRAHWEAAGGLPVYGLPISEEFEERNPDDGKTYTVQYFERARFEYHPEHRATPHEVQLGLLGRQSYTGGGAVVPTVPSDAPEPIPVPAGWRLTWADEFDGAGLDGRTWSLYLPWGSRTNPRDQARRRELQHYAAHGVEVSNGTLKLIARPEPKVYAEGDTAPYAYPYSSGAINTAHKFSQRYGRFEMRAKMPLGRGPWPAFWLLHDPGNGSWPWPPEIDILEYWGAPTEVTGNVYYRDARGAKRQTGPHTFAGPDYTAAFHTFAVEWEPGEVRWFVDGVQRHAVTQGVPDAEMYVILNLAVGGWAPRPDESSVWPMVYEIDWVRCYARAP